MQKLQLDTVFDIAVTKIFPAQFYDSTIKWLTE